jgi:hypothetical protein
MPHRALTKGRNDVTAEGCDQACRFLASLGFPFALRGYANERTAHEAPRALASAEVQMAQVWAHSRSTG